MSYLIRGYSTNNAAISEYATVLKAIQQHLRKEGKSDEFVKYMDEFGLTHYSDKAHFITAARLEDADLINKLPDEYKFVYNKEKRKPSQLYPGVSLGDKEKNTISQDTEPNEEDDESSLIVDSKNYTGSFQNTDDKSVYEKKNSDNKNKTKDTNSDYSKNSSDQVGPKKEGMFCGAIEIARLRPGKNLLIPDIRVKSGIKWKDGTYHSFNGKIGFKCLDLDEKNPKSSMTEFPTRYKITIPRQKYIEPTYIVKMACQSLIKRLGVVYDAINDNAENYYSEKIDIIYESNKMTCKIHGETDQIPLLMKRYTYEHDKSALLATPDKLQTSSPAVYIINHVDPRKITLIGIKTAMSELKNVYNAF